MADTSKVSNAVTWDTWTTAWQNETRTWDELESLMGGTAKPSYIIDSYSETNQDGTSNLRSISNAYKAGQTFTVSVPTRLLKVKFYLKKVGSPTGNSYAKIYALSGGLPTGSPLATSNAFNTSTLSTTSFTLATFNFDETNQITLSAGTYAVTFEPDDLVAGTNTQFGTDTTSPTHSGTPLIYNGTVWSTLTNDMIFYVYGHGGLFTNTAKPS
jgi:hypothetical protein